MLPGRGACSSDTSICRWVILERPALVTEGLMRAESWLCGGGVGACELESPGMWREGGREGGRGIKCAAQWGWRPPAQSPPCPRPQGKAGAGWEGAVCPGTCLTRGSMSSTGWRGRGDRG